MTPRAPDAGRVRRGLPLALVIVATLLAFLATFAVWANRQLLDTDNWTDTSSRMLQNDAIREQLSIFLVDQLYANVDVQARVRQALPPRAAPLAGPAADAVRDLAQSATKTLLLRPRVQTLWEKANRTAHKNLIHVVEGGGKTVSTSGGDVTLDLKSLLGQTESRVGVGGGIAQKLPADAATIQILRSDELDFAQNLVKLLKSLAIALVVLALGLYALAIYLAFDWRRQALRATGLGLVVAGAAALVARSLAGGAVVDALEPTDSIKPAADAAWSIGTSLLVEAATALIAYGIVVVLAAWLAGPTGLAVGSRRALAPYLREPRYAYGGLAVIVLLLLLWGPTPATRKFVPALILVALLVVGVQALRRQTAREYPDASIEESNERLRRRLAGLGQRIRGPRRATQVGGDRRVDELERLAKLRDAGVIDEAEFEREKSRILEAPPAPAGA